MSTFFESTGITPTEMEFISKKVRAIIEALPDAEVPHGSGAVLRRIVELASKDKISARDAALMGFIAGGTFTIEKLTELNRAAAIEEYLNG